MQRLVRVSAIIMLILGVTGLVFGAVLIVAASSIHNETVAKLEAKLPTPWPTNIGDLKAFREAEEAKLGTPGYEPGTVMWDITSAKVLGAGLCLSNLGRAITTQYAGIGILVLGLGLATAGVVQYKMAGRIT